MYKPQLSVIDSEANILEEQDITMVIVLKLLVSSWLVYDS